MKSMQKAKAYLPNGNIANYAQEIKAKVERYEEDKNDLGGLT